ncbi:MAG TPA: hypothetical protein DCX32_01380 [Candidatus Moranbacteria bacterium]|nr:MAG: hypothetical protein UW87_C0047G0014 [Candidatus Moranbacteria bacterium GW2011_GWC2_45_10]KKT94875.1 MAG: hypothetical protein UW95_C0007G0017 [Parcubacteria group bacterium GW2011_GWC1_45_14]HAV11175.1 hypothetical protein [Candidatus Moranbacteria bacterium]
MNEQEAWDTIIRLLGGFGTLILLVKILPEAVIRKIHRLHMLREKIRKEKAFREKYPPHICDRSVDGMCLQCQLDESKAITNGLVASGFFEKFNRGEFRRNY